MHPAALLVPVRLWVPALLHPKQQQHHVSPAAGQLQQAWTLLQPAEHQPSQQQLGWKEQQQRLQQQQQQQRILLPS